jgi:hypothetical protein
LLPGVSPVKAGCWVAGSAEVGSTPPQPLDMGPSIAAPCQGCGEIFIGNFCHCCGRRRAH